MTLDASPASPDPLVVVVEGVEKPGNLGAVLRSADGAGADAVIADGAAHGSVQPQRHPGEPGTIFTRPLGVARPPTTCSRGCASAGVRVIAARVDARAPYTETTCGAAWRSSLGSEAEGLTDAWTAATSCRSGSRCSAIADSLNVSVAAAVLLYEARRQRGVPDRRGPDRR